MKISPPENQKNTQQNVKINLITTTNRKDRMLIEKIRQLLSI